MDPTRGVRGITHSRSPVPVCPAFRICRELNRSYRSPVSDDYHDQQVRILRDLLQAVKEAALRLTQLIERRRNPDAGYRYDGADQQYSASEVVLASPSGSSICALCGVTLRLQNPSKEFVLDEQMMPHDREILLKDLESILPAEIPYRAVSPVKLDKINDDVVESILEHLSPKGGSNPNVGVPAREQDKIIVYPKFRPVDTTDSDLKSKLLFVQRIPSDKIILQIRPNPSPDSGSNPQPTRDIATQVLEQAANIYNGSYKSGGAPTKLSSMTNAASATLSFTISSGQDASTVTQETLCPCACGMLVEDQQASSRVSVESLAALREKLIKTKLEELGLRMPVKKEQTRDSDSRRMREDMKKIMRAQKLREKRAEQRKPQEIAQLQLQAQVEELHRNIRFFREENAHIRRLVEECRYSSQTSKLTGLQRLLPTKLASSGLVIKQAKCCSTQGIVSTLINMIRGSIIVRRITENLIAPFTSYSNMHSVTATRVLSSLKSGGVFPESSTFNVY